MTRNEKHFRRVPGLEVLTYGPGLEGVGVPCDAERLEAKCKIASYSKSINLGREPGRLSDLAAPAVRSAPRA